MSLLRTAFWVCVVIVLIPTGQGSGTGDAEPAGDDALAARAFGAARSTVSDLSSFCDRNPDVCETGEMAFDRFRDKAAVTAGMVYRAVTGSEGTSPTESEAEPVPPRTRPAADHTLTPEDLRPHWRGPDQGDV